MIKVLIPNMPSADELLPYLRRIDASRIFVNSGPLLHELEDKLRGMLSAPVACVANGTLAIELALRAMALPPGSEVLVPAVSFVGGAQAVVNAGLRPVLCDVDPDTWQITPEMAHEAFDAHPDLRCIMPVAAFGRPVGDTHLWSDLCDMMRVRVLIDAAGALLQQGVPPHPNIAATFSLHATKAVGAGEGGAVACSDPAFVARIAELANFGAGGTNGKMSEYHAAVALASLDKGRLARKLQMRQALSDWYAPLPDACTLQQGFGRQVLPTLFPVLLPVPAAGVLSAFVGHGIEPKRWYAPFLHDRGQFAYCPQIGPLPVTRMLAARLIGLPWHDFLNQTDVEHVIETVSRAIQ